MLGGNVADQLLDQHGLAHAGAAKQADLAALGVRGQQVDDLDARFQDLHAAALVCKTRGIPVDRPALFAGSRALVVDGSTQHVEHPAQGPLPHRHFDGPAGGGHRHTAGEALAGGQGDAAHRAIPQMFQHLQHLGFPAVVHGKRVVDLGQLAVFKLNVHHRSQNLQHLPLLSFHERDPFLYVSRGIAPRFISHETGLTPAWWLPHHRRSR